MKVLLFPIKKYPFEIFKRATPGSSQVRFKYFFHFVQVACSNCDQVESVQRGMFDIPDPFLNPRVPCDALPDINLELWKERVECTVSKINIETG